MKDCQSNINFGGKRKEEEEIKGS